MRKIIPLILALILSACLVPVTGAEETAVLGGPFRDFTVQTIDGDTFTLSKALTDHEAVLLNLFATWCGPCRMEFPDLDEAARRYAGQVATIAVSVEPADSADVLRDFRSQLDVSLPMATMPEYDLGAYVHGTPSYSIPTSVLIDRFCNMAFVQVGAFANAAQCDRVYAAALGADYTETRVWTDIPGIKVITPFPEDAALSDALNAEGGNLVFAGDRNEGMFPFVVKPRQDGSAAFASNTGVPGSEARFDADFAADADGALAWEMLCCQDPGRCRLAFTLDGNTVKTMAGDTKGWMPWAVPVRAGQHHLTVIFENLVSGDGEFDLAVDNVRLLTGTAAEAALNALPVWPVSDQSAIVPLSGKRAVITVNDMDLGLDVFVVPGDTARLRIDADAQVDPHGAEVIISGPDVDFEALLCDLYDEAAGGYFVDTPLNGDDASGDHLYGVLFSKRLDSDGVLAALLVRDERYIDEIIDYYRPQGPDMAWAWHYADADNDSPESAYTIRVVDQNGDGVPGAIVNICTDDTCTPTSADESGTILYDGVPQVYHLQILKVPEGYTFDEDEAVYTEATPGKITLVVTRD